MTLSAILFRAPEVHERRLPSTGTGAGRSGAARFCLRRAGSASFHPVFISPGVTWSVREARRP